MLEEFGLKTRRPQTWEWGHNLATTSGCELEASQGLQGSLKSLGYLVPACKREGGGVMSHLHGDVRVVVPGNLSLLKVKIHMIPECPPEKHPHPAPLFLEKTKSVDQIHWQQQSRIMLLPLRGGSPLNLRGKALIYPDLP